MAESRNWAFPAKLQPVPAEVGFDLPRALDAVVSVRTEVPEDAFTASILGTERLGNGVVIRDDGLVLTIGYLITEASAVWLTTNGGNVVGVIRLPTIRRPASAWCSRSAGPWVWPRCRAGPRPPARSATT